MGNERESLRANNRYSHKSQKARSRKRSGLFLSLTHSSNIVQGDKKRYKSAPTFQCREETYMKVGFIGLGTMGSSMALNVRAAGYDIFVNDIRRKASAAHLQAGASWGDSARKVAEAADVVFTSLPGPKEIEEVALAEDGLLAGMRRGTAWFDLSTNSPTVVRRLHERFAAKGVAMLDSPVSAWSRRRQEPQARPVGKRRQDRIRAP